MSAAGVRRLERLKVGGIQVRNFRRLAELARLTPQALRARIGPPQWWVLPKPGEPTPSLSSCPADGAERAAVPREPALSTLDACVSSDRILPTDADAEAQPLAWSGGAPQPVVELERYHGVSASRTDVRVAVSRETAYAPAGSLRRFSVVVDGDCMEPRYRHGELVIFSVDAAEREGILEGRNYFVQLSDGQNTFKRIFFVPDDPDRLLLCCWNPIYPPRTVERRHVILLARAEYRLIPDEGSGHGV